MTPLSDTGPAIAAIVGLTVWLLISVGLYVWYALALAKLFPKIGVESWKGWVPVLNDMEILVRGGVPGWSIVFAFIPFVSVYYLYLRVIAAHRVGTGFGRGAGTTVFAILLPPLWATLLATAQPATGAPLEQRVAGYAASSVAAQPAAQHAASPTAQPATPPVPPPTGHTAGVPPVPPAPGVPPVPLTPGVPPVPPAPASVSSEPAAPAAPAAPAVRPAPQSDPAPTPADAAPAPAMVRPAPQAPAAAPPPPAPPTPVAPPAPVAPPPLIEPVALVVPPPTLVTPALSIPAEAPAAPAPVPPAPAAPAADPAPPASPPAPAPTAAAVVPPAPASDAPDDDEDDFGETVIVERRPRIRFALQVEGGPSLPLTADTVVLGRKPATGVPGTQDLAVPDTTRTLSKVHARVQRGEEGWIITDLESTNGVVVVAADGTETLLERGASAPLTGRFVLGKVAMSIVEEGASA